MLEDDYTTKNVPQPHMCVQILYFMVFFIIAPIYALFFLVWLLLIAPISCCICGCLPVILTIMFGWMWYFKNFMEKYMPTIFGYSWIPDYKEHVSKEYLNHLFHKKGVLKEDENVIEVVLAKQIGEAGLMSDQCLIDVKYDKEVDLPNNFFLKIAPHTKAQRVQLSQYMAGIRESYAYETLFPKHMPDVKIPICYAMEYEHSVGKFIFILENLTLNPNNEFCANMKVEYKHCKLAMKTMAKFHSATLYKDLDLPDFVPQAFKDIPTGMTQFIDNKAKEIGTDFYPWVKETCGVEFSKENIIIQDIACSELGSLKILEKMRDVWNCPSVLYHLDAHSGNYFWNFETNECGMYDLQFYEYGVGPQIDLIIFLLFTPTDVCQTHFAEMIEYYLSCLKEFGVDTSKFEENFLNLCLASVILISTRERLKVEMLAMNEVDEALKERGRCYYANMDFLIMHYNFAPTFLKLMGKDVSALNDSEHKITVESKREPEIQN